MYTQLKPVALIIALTSSEGNIDQPIWMDDILCSTDEEVCLQSCQKCPSTNHDVDCTHLEDIAVSCGQ